jgi:hydroxymethylpyrimidine pyrophosphatase-like HAD family hydrolase
MSVHGGPSAEAWEDNSPSESIPGTGRTALATELLEEEIRFYGRYRWSLNPFSTLDELRRRLQDELRAWPDIPDDWRRQEVLANVFLLSCALADSVDDHLAGEGYDFSRAVAVLPGLRRLARGADALLAGARALRTVRVEPLRRWREEWGAAVHAFTVASLAAPRAEPLDMTAASTRLSALLDGPLPSGLVGRRVGVPAAFRSQDLALEDFLELTARFVDAFPDRGRPLVVVGLRTAGSYFAPLVRAVLARRGYGDVESLTLRPKRGLPRREQAVLARGAHRGALALVVDEPPDTGATVAAVVAALRRSGVPDDRIVALLPIHPSRRDWQDGCEAMPLAGIRLLTLEPEAWHKERRLAAARIEERLETYFRARGYSHCSVLSSPAAERLNRQLASGSEQKFHTRLKRVYAVSLLSGEGRTEWRYVLAKSVGWGWLGYHAFLAAEALREFVPPVLGLRDGLLFTEWLPQTRARPERERGPLPERLAAYVVARRRRLALDADPAPELERRYQKGVELLASALGGAYGWKPAVVLERSRLQRALRQDPSPAPTLIDGRMSPREWVSGPSAILKTDFEHHGIGKTELNVTDPAYDLADAILHFKLSADEEERLLGRYQESSGDATVEERLFFFKLLAGTVALRTALSNLGDVRLRGRHEEFHRGFVEATEFLIAQAARACGTGCRPPQPPRWSSPLVVLDVDGVLDKQVFGFPSTTAAGIEALRLLHAHGAAVALNTARTLEQVREYCQAYGLVGGVAEYGAVVWDAVSDRQRVLVAPDSREELRRLAEALARLPGVFLNPLYRHSLRAYTFGRERTVPLPLPLVEGLVSELGLERLVVRQTYIDTTVVAAETDKGKGLLALRELAGRGDIDTVAIGDSEPDLPMFRVARRSFAPRQIACRGVAQQLGCRIAARSYQPGLLRAVRSVVHPRVDACRKCQPGRRASGMWWELLRAADRHPLASLLRALAGPHVLEAFRR